ncbi:MAG: patatin family protein [Clostridia bacterium]|nr:patatin family protein [Clostridia bacterium]
MTGLIDVGGGMKCSYSAGLYDYFMDNGIEFDYYLGVSAGSMNLLSYIAGERGRNIKIYRSSAEGNEYLSISNFIHSGAYMNYEKVSEDFYSDHGADPFDFKTFFSSEKPFVVCATEAVDAVTEYFDRSSMTDRKSVLDIICASCCIPVVSKAVEINGKEYFDGGLVDPIPFMKAFDDGCDKIVVVLSAPADQKKEHLPGMNIIAPALLREYPLIDDIIVDRPIVYNYLIRCLRKYVQQGRALLLSPEEIPGATVLAKDREVVDKLYDNGYRDGLKYINEIKRLLEKN